MNPRVFISHSSKDKAVGDAACARLEARGHRCWIAPRDILPGREWGEAIVEGIAASKVFVLIFSANANESPQIRREIERAVHHGLNVVPFRIEDVAPAGSLEYFMSVPHWLDAMTPPLDRHLDALAEVVGRLLNDEIVARDLAPQVPRRSSGGGSLAVVAILVAAPVLAAVAGLDPPWPAHFGYVSAAIVAAGAGWAHYRTRAKTPRWLIPTLVGAGLLAYLSLASLFVESVPMTDVRLVKGFTCTADARLVYGDGCPALNRDALRDAEWEPATLWTASSLLAARMALVASWLVLVAGLALAAAAVEQRRIAGRGRERR